VEAAVVDPRTLLEMSLSEDQMNRPNTGMIPSQQLEEKRKAFVRPEFDYTQKSCELLIFVHFLLSFCRGTSTHIYYDR